MALISVTISGNAAPLKKSVDESEGLLGKLGGSFTKIGVIGAAGFAAVAAGIGFAAKAAAEDQKSFALLENTIRNVTGATHDQIKAVDDQIGKMSLATGVADDKLRPAFEALVRGTRDTELAMSQMSLVLDISTSLQTDATVVADALAKAQQGNTKALAALSPEMKTMIKEGASMEQILETLTANFDGAADAAANTFGGQLARLKVFLSELVEQIGYYVLPVLSKIAEFIVQDVVPAFTSIIEKHGPALAAIFQKIADFIADKVVPVLRDKLIPFITVVAEFIGEKLVPIIRDSAIVIFGKLGDIFDTVSKKIEENRGNIDKLVTFFGDLVGFITKYVAPTLVKVLGVAFDIVGKAIGPIIDVVFTLMGALASLGSFLLKIAGFVVNTFEGMVNAVIDGVNFAIRALNLLPGVDIDPIGGVSFGGASFGTAPTAPGQGAATTSPSAGRFDPDFPGGATSMPSFAAPSVITTPTAGAGGGGGGAAVRILPIDMEGQIPIIGGPFSGGGGAGVGGNLAGNEAMLDGAGGTVVNITVNTVTADANLPNLIVEALQQYNLVSGPADFEIAV